MKTLIIGGAVAVALLAGLSTAQAQYYGYQYPNGYYPSPAVAVPTFMVPRLPCNPMSREAYCK